MEERVRVGGVELAYEIAGSGPRAVWLHGLASCRDGDRDVIDALARGFTVLAYDARGHGRSEPVRDAARYSYRALADDLLGLLEAVGWERPILAGASMGAATAATATMTGIPIGAFARASETSAHAATTPATPSVPSQSADQGPQQAGPAPARDARPPAHVEPHDRGDRRDDDPGDRARWLHLLARIRPARAA